MRLLPITSVFILLLAFTGCGDADLDGNETATPDDTDVQVAYIEASNDGFQPSSVALEANSPARLVITRTEESDCVQAISIPAFGVEERDLPLDEPVEIELTAQQDGEFVFTCGMDMQEGSILVES